MKDIIWIVLLSTCISAMIPAAKSNGIRNAITFITGLAVLVVICVPIGQAADSLRAFPGKIIDLLMPDAEEMEQTEIQSEKWVIRYGVKNIERGIQSLITSRFTLDPSGVYVEAVTGMAGDGAVTIDKIYVYLLDDTVCDRSSVERYISDLLACPCEVLRRTT